MTTDGGKRFKYAGCDFGNYKRNITFKDQYHNPSNLIDSQLRKNTSSASSSYKILQNASTITLIWQIVTVVVVIRVFYSLTATQKLEKVGFS